MNSLQDKIVILTAIQRSGTYYLKSLLSCSKDIYPTSEVLIYDSEKSGGEGGSFWPFYLKKVAENTQNALPSERLRLIQEFMRHFADGQGESRVVFDIKCNSLHHGNGFFSDPAIEMPLLLRSHMKERFRTIHLVRNNILRILISRLRADQNHIYHLEVEEAELKENKKKQSEKITINTDALVKTLSNINEQQEIMKNMISPNKCGFTVYYEELVRTVNAKDKSVTGPLFEFLGVKHPESLATSFVKTTPDDLSLVVENWEEVRATVQKTQWAKFLENY